MERVIIFLISLLSVLPLSAQIGFGGTPPSWSLPKSNLKSCDDLKSNIISNPFTIEELLKDEASSEGLPERVGINLSVQLSVAKDGEWEMLPTGEKISRLKIESLGAIAISLYYSQFDIPQGAKLYIYNDDHTHLLGAYTSETNPEGGVFATEFVAGDNLILEYVASPNGDMPRIEIDKICYGYKNLKVTTSELLGCMVDVVCSEGDDWQNEKDGVVKIVTKIGNYSFLCSATLLNNTAQDFTPYIYTAFHCLEDAGVIASEIDLKQMLFYFNYEAVECGSDEIKESTTLVGCKFLEGKSLDDAEGLDQAFLLMTSDIPASITPYFNGWDRGVIPPKSGVSIHHPKGAVKKISTYISPAVSGTWPSAGGGVNAHWVVEFTSTANGFSATEGGSSGSPLFSQDKLVTGALTGGNSSCSNPKGSNYYGKIQYFWPYISKYLDPLNSGAYLLQGARQGEITPSPKALNAKWIDDGSKVELSWLPLEITPTNYIIYRNGVIIGNCTSTSFVDDKLYTGEHVYQVSAYYADKDIETLKSNQSIITKYPIVTPTIDIIERISENNVAISWSLPQSEQQIFWGGEEPSVKIRSQSKLPIYFGQMWSMSDLSEIEGYVIKRVETSCLAGIDYTLYIRQGANIYTQAIPMTSVDKDVVITLDKEFVINNREPLYCALRVNKGEGYFIKVDGEKIVEERGNMVSLDGYEWNGLDTKGNIYMKPTISPPLNNFKGVENTSNFTNTTVFSSVPAPFKMPKEYKIYRNGELITTLSGEVSKYTDRNLQKGFNYEYIIEAIYSNNEVVLSMPYKFYLRDKSFKAQIENVTVNGIGLSEERGKQYNYAATCSEDIANIVITAKENGKVIIGGKEGEIFTQDISSGGKYILPITIISESEESRTEYGLNIYKLPSDIVVKRWNDVISIINNPENNGGLSFVEFKWYLNGEELPDTTPYITIPKATNVDDMLMLKVVTEEGVELQSCEMDFEASESTILLYPTYVDRGGEVILNITALQPCSIKASLSHVTGVVQPLTLTMGDNIIKAPQTPGTYIVNVVLSSGESKSLKFIVK